MDQYCVIRMDLMDSRKIEQRNEVQKHLIESFTRMNTEYAKDLAAPITMILGDEWTIVLKNGSIAYEVYLNIRGFLKVYGLEAYTAIGYGSIRIDAQDIRRMSGSAFDHAKISMRIAKSSKYAYKKEIPTKQCNVYVSGLPSIHGISYDDLLNPLIQNNEILLSKITDKQEECIRLYEKYQSYTEILAAVPDMTKRMLSDCLNTAEYWLIRENTAMIHQMLRQIYPS